MYKLLSVGADPELFLKDQEGKPVPCVGLLPGTKKHPHPIFDVPGFAVQEDNVMAEFNIPPATNKRTFDSNIERVLRYLEKYFVKMDYSIDISATRLFLPEQLKTEQAQTMGCDPDFSAWLRRRNPPPDPKIAKTGLRSAGGHIHVGFSRADGEDTGVEDVERVVKLMDIFLGLPAIFIDPDVKRKELYGKPGAFRPKPYGIEYRSLSNFWISKSVLRQWVFTQCQAALEDNKRALEYMENYDRGDSVHMILNSNNKEQARALINHLRIAIPDGYALA